jgi:CHRD domain-containing protein
VNLFDFNLKIKLNVYTICGLLGFLAILLICGTTTNGFNSISAQQKQQHFNAILLGSKGVPPVQTSAIGVAKFTLSNDGKWLGYVLTVLDINNVIGAHIHMGNSTQNGPIEVFLYGNHNMTQPPTGKVDGVLSRGFISDSDLTGPMAGKHMQELLNQIQNGYAYVNVHTTQNPNGEIRGQIEIPQ